MIWVCRAIKSRRSIKWSETKFSTPVIKLLSMRLSPLMVGNSSSIRFSSGEKSSLGNTMRETEPTAMTSTRNTATIQRSQPQVFRIFFSLSFTGCFLLSELEIQERVVGIVHQEAHGHHQQCTITHCPHDFAQRVAG